MNVGNQVRADVAVQAGARRPSEPPVRADAQASHKPGREAAAPRSDKAASDSRDTVTLSSRPDRAAQADKPAQAEKAAQPSQPAQGGASLRQPLPALNPNLRADYTVSDGGELVVRIVDRDNDQVVRQIPDEEQQRIRQAIAEANKSQGLSPTVAAEKPQAAPVDPKASVDRPELTAGFKPAAQGANGVRPEQAAPETQVLGSRETAAAPQAQLAGQARTAEGAETQSNRSGSVAAGSDPAQDARQAAGSGSVETATAVQERGESSATPDSDADGDETGADAGRRARQEVAATASRFTGAPEQGVGRAVDVTG